MSEEQADYITDAVEMMGNGYDNAAEIHPPKTIQVIRDNGLEEYRVWGWVKVSATFVHHIRRLKGAKLAIWQVIALSIDGSGECSLSIHDIAELAGYSYSETHQSLKELDEMGYLSIQKESGRKSLYSPNFSARGQNQPNDDPSRKTIGTPLQSSGEDPSSPSIEKAHSSIKELKELKDANASLSEKDYQQVNAKVDAMIANSSRADWQGRETFRPDHYPLVDWYHRVTGQDCPKSKQKDWHKAVMMWASNGLTVDDLQAAYDMDIKWRGVFTSPNQLTDKAIALRAQKQTAPQDERPLPPPVPERIGVPNPFKKPENIK